MQPPKNVLDVFDQNAELALDEIGFGPPDVNHVRHCKCPFHPNEPDHQVGANFAYVSKCVACDIEELDKDALDVYRVANGISDRAMAATMLIDSLIAKHGKEALKLEALNQRIQRR